MNNLEILYKLQCLDDKRKELANIKEDQELLKKISKVKQEISYHKEQLKLKNKKLKEIKDQIKNKEFEDARLIRKEKDYNQQLYSGDNSSSKELEKLQKKLNQTQSNKEKVEDQLLELMMALENKEEEINDLEKSLNNAQEQLEKLTEEYNQSNNKVEQKLIKMQKEKQKLVSSLPEDLVTKYNNLCDRKYGKAVAKLKDGYCMGCRMTLPVNLIKQVKKTNELTICENCGRILYWID